MKPADVHIHIPSTTTIPPYATQYIYPDTQTDIDVHQEPLSQHKSIIPEWYNRPEIRWARRQVEWLPSYLSLTYGQLIIIIIYIIVNLSILIPLVVTLAQADYTDERIMSDNSPLPLHTWANYTGTLGTILSALMLLPVTRNSILLPLFGIPFDSALLYHKYTAVWSMLVLGFHMATELINAVYTHDLGFPIDKHYTSVQGIGFGSWFAGLAALLFSTSWIRRNMFNLFYQTHFIWFLGFVVMGSMHDIHVAYYLAIPLALWLIDITIRAFMLKRPVQIQAIEIMCHNVVRIQFTAPFKYQSGQYIFVCIPAISPFELHPFSLSSSPHHPYLMLHVQVFNNWTNKLLQLALENPSKMPAMYVEGPYGRISLPLHKYETIVLCGAGIGSTPMHSLLNSIMSEWLNGTRQLHRLHYIWSCRDAPLMIQSFTDPLAAKLPYVAGQIEKNKLRTIDDVKRVLKFSIHLTDPKSNEEQLGLLRKLLNKSMHLSRPDFLAILQDVQQCMLQNGDERCAVVISGPSSFEASVRQACEKLTSNEMSLDVLQPATYFDVHAENYAL